MAHNKSVLIAGLFLAAIALANCSPKTNKAVTKTTTTPAPEVHYTEAQLAEGKTVFTNNCGRCHKLFEPSSKSLSTWEKVLPSMIHKAKLSDAQGALVRAYVMANLK